jgi:ribonuclease-3
MHVHSPADISVQDSQELLQALGAQLAPDLLVHALTHRSFSNENTGIPNNERLEFLGDAVLELVVTETIYTRHPSFSEGQLAKIRAAAVSERSLSQIAREKLHLGPFILLGKGERDQNGADKSSILCDTVESLIGAVFISHGINEARTVVHRLIDETLERVEHAGPALDWKTSLTVLSHELNIDEPFYHMSVGGPEDKPVFTANVSMGDEPVIASAQGSSKRKAQLAAAKAAYELLAPQRAK